MFYFFYFHTLVFICLCWAHIVQVLEKYLNLGQLNIGHIKGCGETYLIGHFSYFFYERITSQVTCSHFDAVLKCGMILPHPAYKHIYF